MYVWDWVKDIKVDLKLQLTTGQRWQTRLRSRSPARTGQMSTALRRTSSSASRQTLASESTSTWSGWTWRPVADTAATTSRWVPKNSPSGQYTETFHQSRSFKMAFPSHNRGSSFQTSLKFLVSAWLMGISRIFFVIKVYDGCVANDSSNLLAFYTGDNAGNRQQVTSNCNKMMIHFHSDKDDGGATRVSAFRMTKRCLLTHWTAFKLLTHVTYGRGLLYSFLLPTNFPPNEIQINLFFLAHTRVPPQALIVELYIIARLHLKKQEAHPVILTKTYTVIFVHMSTTIGLNIGNMETARM